MQGRIGRIACCAGTLVALAACGHKQPDALVATNTAAPAPDDPNAVSCAPAGETAFKRQCTVDRETAPRGLLLTLTNPDGGFHRVLVTQDGRGVIAADGAQGAKVTITGPDEIEVQVAGDRYRLPATVGGRKRPG